MSSAHNPYGRICRRSSSAVEAKNTSRNASRTSAAVTCLARRRSRCRSGLHRELGVLGDALVHVDAVPMPANDHCAKISADSVWTGSRHLCDGDDRAGEQELRDERERDQARRLVLGADQRPRSAGPSPTATKPVSTSSASTVSVGAGESSSGRKASTIPGEQQRLHRDEREQHDAPSRPGRRSSRVPIAASRSKTLFSLTISRAASIEPSQITVIDEQEEQLHRVARAAARAVEEAGLEERRRWRARAPETWPSSRAGCAGRAAKSLR